MGVTSRADTYKMVAGIVLFIVFISTATFMLSGSFPDIAPAGVPNASQVAHAAQTPAFAKSTCGPGDWTCGVANFFVGVANTLVQAGAMFTAIGGFFIGLIAFQIPALQANPFTQLINVMISVPIIVVLGLFIFRATKSLVPTVGGDVD